MSFYSTKEYDLAVTIRCQGYSIHDSVRGSISSMPCGSSMTWLEISSIIINEIEKNASNWTKDEKGQRDSLTASQLEHLAMVERVIASTLMQGIEKGMNYKDIYKLASRKAKQVYQVVIS